MHHVSPSGGFIPLYAMPTSKTSTKERVEALYNSGFTAKEIAEIVSRDISYVYKIIKGFTKPQLTIENYIAAESRGIKSRGELAAFFDVSERTISRFRNKPEMKEYWKRYIELRRNGYGLNEVLQRLTSIHETLVIFEPKSNITQRVSQAIELLTAVPKRDNSHKC